MFAATTSAMIGSRRSQPVRTTAPTPAITPTEVNTSVIRCWPSASSTTESCSLPVLISSRAMKRLSTVATSETPMPTPIDSSGWGSRRRTTAVIAIDPAARRISPPSSPAE